MRGKTVLLFLGLAILSSMWLLYRCVAPYPEQPRRHDCPPESLLVDISLFPADMISDEPMHPLPDGGGTSIGVDMGNGSIDISHDVYPYRIPRGAEKRFKEEVGGIRRGHPEHVLIDITDLGLQAEQAALFCGPKKTNPRCIYLARYDNFYVEFFLRAPEIDNPLEVIYPAIKDIDQKMRQCLAEHPGPGE